MLRAFSPVVTARPDRKKTNTLRNNLPLPPGPRGLPMLGSLQLLIKDAHLAINSVAR